MTSYRAQILTPEGCLFDDEVTGVRVPGEMGSFEIKTLHANIISTLEIGEILVRLATGDEKHFAVTSGFVEMVDNKLTLLAEAAEPVEEIDVERAKAAKERARERIESDDPGIDKNRARKALQRAENRINLAAGVTFSTQ